MCVVWLVILLLLLDDLLFVRCCLFDVFFLSDVVRYVLFVVYLLDVVCSSFVVCCLLLVVCCLLLFVGCALLYAVRVLELFFCFCFFCVFVVLVFVGWLLLVVPCLSFGWLVVDSCFLFIVC